MELHNFQIHNSEIFFIFKNMGKRMQAYIVGNEKTKRQQISELNLLSGRPT